MTGPLRSLWNAPGAVPPPPRRVWRDWALVAVVPLFAFFEGLIRSELPWTLLAVLALLAVTPTLLWRRTRPLLMLAICFAVGGLVAVVTGGEAMLLTTAFVLLLPYALFRWGNGRAIIIGGAVILANLAVSLIGSTALADLIGELVIVLLTIAPAIGLRYRANTRLRELERARLLEREQLARDLHDTVAHHVSAIAIRAQAGLATAALNPNAATDALMVIEAEASTTLAEMRSMVRVLRRDETAELAPSPRIADLERLAGTQQGGVAIEVTVTGDTEAIPPTVAAAVYRLAQESITNARRHARHATRIDVRVDSDDAGIRMSVTDDGDSGPAGTPGYGITGMVERAALLGGTCQAGRAPGRGWAVTAVLPRAGWSG